MSRIRILTPIISEGFRDNTPLQASVPDSCTINQVFLQNGPASVESAVDEVLAAPGVLDAGLCAEAEGVDALVIDCMLDPALDAVRELVSIPVVGCGEAGMQAAAAMGRFSIITVLQRQERDFRTLAKRYDVAHRLASVRGIGVSVLALEEDRENSISATIDSGRSAVEQDDAEVIVFGCTGMLGFAQPVAEALGLDPARVIDPLPHAVRLAHALVEAGSSTDKALYPAPEPKRVTGFGAWRVLDSKMADRS